MLSRREVLQLIAATLAAPNKGPKTPKKGTVIGPGFYIDTDTQKKNFVLALLDLDAPKLETREIALDFFAHGVTPNPKQASRAVLLEKKGPGACEVDLVEGKMLRKITTTPERRFYGHGAWSQDASLIYVVESVINEAYKGVISVRDGRTFETMHLFPTYGLAPHDVRLIDGDKTMVITNGGGDIKGDALGCVTYVDVASEKLIEKVELNSRLNAGHLAVSSKRDLAVISAPREGVANPTQVPGGLSLRRAGGKLQMMSEPPEIIIKMLGETLSVALHEKTDVVAATNPTGNVITFWKMKNGAFVKRLDYPYPRGIALTLDEKHFVVSYGQAQMILVDAKTLAPVESSKFEGTAMTGSHVITYAMPS